MAVFFLHYRSCAAEIRDLEGAEFANLEEAKEEAIAAARAFISAAALNGFVDLTAALEIQGQDGQITIVRFSEAIELRT
jgi:hypothetical protein